MEKFGDDELASVLKRICSWQDRNASSLVCKQWLRVEGLTRTSLHILEPKLLRNFLPRFPNLVTIDGGRGITDSDLEFIAETCPNAQIINLNLRQTQRVFDEFGDLDLDEVGDDGVCSLAIGCRNLTRVYLRRRKGIGDVGVVALIKSTLNLTVLDLAWCDRVTDQALEALGASNSLQVLNLHGCCLITDWGLASLATGSLSQTLKKLDLAECDQITDFGVSFLQLLYCLETLNLAECGPKVTDTGGVAVASICKLKRLDFSWLINISDVTIVAIAQNCHYLESLDATGCELITGSGVRSFSTHKSLEVLKLASCYNVFGVDVEQMVLECQSLRYIGLDKGLRAWIPMAVQDKLSKLCRLDWL